MTPLQEAMFAATIANRGTLMKPYLVQQVLGPGLSVIQSHTPTVLSQAVSPQVAGYLQDMMYPGHPQPGGHRVRDRRAAGDRRHHD